MFYDYEIVFMIEVLCRLGIVTADISADEETSPDKANYVRFQRA